MKKQTLTIIFILILVCSVILNIYLLFINNKEQTDQIIAEKDEKKQQYEIERKWLVDINNLPFDLEKSIAKMDLEQAYLCFEPEIRVRKITWLGSSKKEYVLDIKANLSNNGLQREEYEFNLSQEDYNNLLEKKDETTTIIHKTRYGILEDDKYYYLDVYHDNLDGLATVEVEGPKNEKRFKTQEEANNFEPASWVGKEVTDNIRYKNQNLAKYGIPVDN